MNAQLYWPDCWDSWSVDNREAVFNMPLWYNKTLKRQIRLSSSAAGETVEKSSVLSDSTGLLLVINQTAVFTSNRVALQARCSGRRPIWSEIKEICALQIRSDTGWDSFCFYGHNPADSLSFISHLKYFCVTFLTTLPGSRSHRGEISQFKILQILSCPFTDIKVWVKFKKNLCSEFEKVWWLKISTSFWN